jgi:hypothetical protein
MKVKRTIKLTCKGIKCDKEFEVPDTKRGRSKMCCSQSCASRLNNTGKRHTEEWKKMISEGQLGEKNHFYGRTHSDKTKAQIGKKNSGTYEEKYGEEKANLIRAKISESQIGEKNHFYGKTHTSESRAKLGRDMNGENNPMYGKGYLLKGDKNGAWKGGISLLYGEEFNNELKTEIRKRDKFTCGVCEKNGYIVHHIDYNKHNNNKNNLITLCSSDHGKTGFNRESWQVFFKLIMEKKEI